MLQAFFALVFLLSVPFWFAGGVTGFQFLPGLPASSLATICPALAAFILVYREKGWVGVTELVRRAVDYKKLRAKLWFVPIVVGMPFVLFLSYYFMRIFELPLPDPKFPIIAVPVMLVAFFIGALGEELGWTGYATEPIERMWSAPTAGIVLGVVWAAWHLVPYEQAHRAPAWILWQCLFTVAFRVLLVWIYIAAGRSVFGVALTHAMANLSMFLFPNYGSHYDPLVTSIVIGPLAILAGISLNRNRHNGST
jgi:uncharacterized protein